MYNNYISFVEKINSENISSINFKNNNTYNSILEHVSKEQGQDYMNIIQNEFPEIGLDNIIAYCNINDLYGYPKLEIINSYNTTILCSPTSVRYIYHSLLILNYYKSSGCSNMCEVGCGYGGLFLAINFFSKILNVSIDNYHMVDLPAIGTLISNYMKINEHNIYINYNIHNAYNYGSDITSDNLFFISNYCFTEIDYSHRIQYMNTLINKTNAGFIIWQTVFDKIPIDNIEFSKSISVIEEERPQTATIEYKNYFVYF